MRLKKKLICLLVVSIMMLQSIPAAFAANEFAYSGSYNYVSYGDGVTLATGTYNYGFLGLSKGKWKIKKTGIYSGYISSYKDKTGSPTWFANQGQILSITESYTANRTVAEAASYTGSISTSGSIGFGSLASIGIDASASMTKSYSNSFSTTYSKSTCSSYNLANFKHKSYTFASWGIICKNTVYKYDKNGKQTYSKNMYTYYKAYGQEMRLVYR